MKILVKEHELVIDQESKINEKEIDITKCEFEFDESITDTFVKDVYFTLDDTTIQMPNIQNNECKIPPEVLVKNGTVEIGVVPYTIENGEYIQRYNPTSTFFTTDRGSLKEEYENSEEITPSDKEQIEQQLLNISTQMDNIDIEASKEEHTTTITITRKDGTSYDVEVLDGEKGEKGDKGDPGQIKFIIVPTLPTQDIDESAIYLVPITPDIEGNNYKEYIYVNNQWELLGKIGVQIDLTDYVKNTDYASASVGGVIKTPSTLGIGVGDTGNVFAQTSTYAEYGNRPPGYFIGKATLDNVITGKGLVSNTSYASASVGGVIKVDGANYGSYMTSSGILCASMTSYANYGNKSNNYIISKGTLENVLTAKIGDIQTLLDNLNNGGGVQ